MNPSQKPFRINVGFLINQPIGYSRVLPIKLDTIDIEDESLHNFNGSIELTRTQDGLIAQVVIDVEVEVEFKRRAYNGKQRGDVKRFRLVATYNVENGKYHLYITNIKVFQFVAYR